jgi:hypothetical protein
MLRAYDSAELVLTAIEEHPGGLNMRMLLHETGLTSGQYRRAYNWTLDNFDEPIWIKNWVGGEWVYLLPDIKVNAMEDWKRTIKTQVTRARREHNKIHAIAQRHKTVDNRLSEELARTRLEQLKIERDRLKA